MEISKLEVLKIAQMSRIAIQDDEVDEIEKHLRDVINYAERVVGLVQSNQQPFYLNKDVFRQDQAIPSDSQSLLDLAPQTESGFYVVPAVLEQE